MVMTGASGTFFYIVFQIGIGIGHLKNLFHCCFTEIGSSEIGVEDYSGSIYQGNQIVFFLSCNRTTDVLNDLFSGRNCFQIPGEDVLAELINDFSCRVHNYGPWGGFHKKNKLLIQ